MKENLQGEEPFRLSKAKLNIYSSLDNVKMRRKHQLFVAEGEKCVGDTLRSFKAEALVARKGASIPQEWEKSGARIYLVGEDEMRRLSNFVTSPDYLGVFQIPEERMPQITPGGLYVMLDGVRDPGNLGTILRTCHWFGIKAILASRDCADLYNPKCVQACMGSLGHLPVGYVNLEEVIDSNPGMPVYGLLLEGKDIYRAPLRREGFIVMGNEGKGISEAIRRKVTHPLTIPPYSQDHGESLNVGAATAATLAIFRCRE